MKKFPSFKIQGGESSLIRFHKIKNTNRYRGVLILKKKDLTKLLMGLALILQLSIALFNFFNLNNLDYNMFYYDEISKWNIWERVMNVYASMSLYSVGLILNCLIFILGCFVFFKYLKTGTVNALFVGGLGFLSFITNPLGGILWCVIAAKYHHQLDVKQWVKRLLIMSVILVAVSPILRMFAPYMILIQQPIISAHLSSFDSLLLPSFWARWFFIVDTPQIITYMFSPITLFIYISAIVLGFIMLYQKIDSKNWKMITITTFIVQSFVMNIGALFSLVAIILVFAAQQSTKTLDVDEDI